MAFLSISGMEIPISTASNPEEKVDIIGDKSEGYNGATGSAIRNYRRKWDFTTKYLTRSQAEMIKNLITAKGHTFSFDNKISSGKLLAGTFSRASARLDVFGTTVATGTPSYGFGMTYPLGSLYIDAVYDNDFSVLLEEGTSPLLGTSTVLDVDTNADGVADGMTLYVGAIAPFGTGTLSMDTTQAFMGAGKCQKIVKTNDVANSKYGFQSAMVSCNTLSTASFLFNIEALGGTNPTLRIKYDYYQSDGLTYVGSNTTDLTETTSGWVYAYHSNYYDVDAAKCQISVYLYHGTGTAYIQALQLENKEYSTYIHDTATRPAETLTYKPSMFNNYTNSFSIAVQTQLDGVAMIDSVKTLWHVYIDDQNYWKLAVRKNLIPYFEVYGDGSLNTTFDGVSSTATSGSATTLVDSAKTWDDDMWLDYEVTIVKGTGSGQTRTISTNDSTTLTVSADWDTNPDVDSEYEIYPAGESAYALDNVGGWTVLTTVCDRGTAYFYVNGVLYKEFYIDSPRKVIQKFYVGSDKSGANQANCLYDAMIVLPYAIDADFVYFLYNKTKNERPLCDFPYLDVYGTFINRTSINPIVCEGIFHNYDIKQFATETRYKINFSLVEVI